MDSDGWQRILCSKSFKSASVDLCEAIARLAKKLSTKLVDPEPLSSYIACRLIPLDKNPGIRPIGIGEVLRRIIGKAITTLVKPEILAATAPLQACAGLQGGVEAAIHSLRTIFEDTDSHGILLVDADNAFNALNRANALHNTRIICPEFSVYIINTYRKPAKLFIPNSGGKFILSEEGTTQGDNCASGLYACSLMPLMSSVTTEEPPLAATNHANITALTEPTPDKPADTTIEEPLHSKCLSEPPPKHIWFADDSAAGGSLCQIKKWWDNLVLKGPSYGYYPKPSKTWLVVKEQHLHTARAMFKDINITTEGRRYLGSYIGTNTGKQKFMQEKTEQWIEELQGLCTIAKREPQLAYAAFVYGSSRRWGYFMRTTPDISGSLQPVEEEIKSKLVPALIGRTISQDERNLLALPARYGGLGLINPMEMADREYNYSTIVTEQLVKEMLLQHNALSVDQEAVNTAKTSVTRMKNVHLKTIKEDLIAVLPPSRARFVELACEKGSSSWITTLPLEEYGFALNKQEFQDAISLRYGYSISGIAKKCICGQTNTIDHCLICKKGGFVSLRHNTLRDTTAKLLSDICKDVQIEPPLLPLTGEILPSSSNITDDARLDVSARGFWTPLGRAFFDIRVLHPGAPTNATRSLPQMYSQHEQEKKRKYNDRVIEVERGTFTPLVFSTTGGMGKEASIFLKRLATLLAPKTNQTYSNTIGYLRRRLRFDLLRTTLIALRGHRGKYYEAPSSINDLDINLQSSVTEE